MLFDKYGEYHKEQKKEWQIDKGIKKRVQYHPYLLYCFFPGSGSIYNKNGHICEAGISAAVYHPSF